MPRRKTKQEKRAGHSEMERRVVQRIDNVNGEVVEFDHTPGDRITLQARGEEKRIMIFAGQIGKRYLFLRNPRRDYADELSINKSRLFARGEVGIYGIAEGTKLKRKLVSTTRHDHRAIEVLYQGVQQNG